MPSTCDLNGACVSAPKVCDNPPASPVPTNCPNGTQFPVYLGGSCGGTCTPGTGICTYSATMVDCPATNTTLPQKHGYQVILRNYMASLTDAGVFTPPTQSTQAITYSSGMSLNDDQLYQLWMGVTRSAAGANFAPNLPSYEGVLHADSRFLLSTIESTSPPQATIEGEASMSVEALAWYTTWNYAGNPFFNSEALRRRAFVMTAADMMWMDRCWETNTCQAGDYLAGAMRQYGYVGLVTRNATTIPSCVQAAYRVGQRRHFTKMESLNYSSPNSDITMAAIPAMIYMAQTNGDPDLWLRAAAKADNILAANCSVGGYCTHQGGGYDASYEGYSMVHLIEALQVAHFSGVQTWVDRFMKLKAYSTLPEPDNRTFVGPSHFSPATTDPAAKDQAAEYTRDLAVAFNTSVGTYLAFGGRTGWPTFPTQTFMRSDINSFMTVANNFASQTGTPTFQWRERHYPYGQQPALRHYTNGTYASLAALGSANSPFAKPPFSQPTDFVQIFGTEFVSAKVGNTRAIIHTGSVDGSNAGSGFGGGALSAFSTDTAGAAILGWNRGSQSTLTNTPYVPNPFTWADWKIWPSHAISGIRGGKQFSSARVTNPSPAFNTATANQVTVTVTGQLNNSSAAPNSALPANVSYDRTFVVNSTGVTITSKLTPTGSITVDELYEVLPILLDTDGTMSNTSIQWVPQGSTTPATANATPTLVDTVIVNRYSGKVRIEFSSPRSVHLAPTVSDQPNYQQTRPRSQNLLIDFITTPGAIPTAPLTYTIKKG